ncbi:MAG: hypothetical protein ACOCZM_02960 [Bacillota bacterium]
MLVKFFTPEEKSELKKYLRPPVINYRGEQVGEIRVEALPDL